MWDEPAFPNGIIKEYIISYGTSRDYQRSKETVTGNKMKGVLDGLDKFTTYFVKVRGKTSMMGIPSKILNTTTFEDSKLQPAVRAVFIIIIIIIINALFKLKNPISDFNVIKRWYKPEIST